MDHHERLIIPTADGSHTISLGATGITYHSTHGAMQESMQVFIQTGLLPALQRFNDKELLVFEMGFGTGLNALLTAIESEREKRSIHYTTLELFPLRDEELARLNYAQEEATKTLFGEIHAAAWEKETEISPYFALIRHRADLLEFTPERQYHLIYYDAFAPGDQPELWTVSLFKKLYDMLVYGGMLVTYCSKSVVRRAMSEAGFTVSKMPGPHGKREILRAEKAISP